MLIRESWPGQQVKDAPWTDMSGLSWRDARLSAYRNYGPGAGVNGDRPQLSAARARALTPERYLAGADGRNPTLVPRRHPAEVLLHPVPAGAGAGHLR
ncbi:hypothetical protein GCM10009733_022840 [Nonomuraea maheshkhaliensis]|uniref:Uncharacterized protein n=1 Tax=Nonomuraea maheshkhaliensis TaxID=419590 RepID=A0ABN2F1U1_9ACTN